MLNRRGFARFCVMGAGIGVVGLAPTGRALATAADLIGAIIDRGVLRVGVGNSTPWVFRSKSGELIGFDVDVARRLASDMGVDIELVPTVWERIIPSLLAGDFDLVISGMSLRPDRMLQVNFTIPYASAGNMLAASRSRLDGARTLDAFNRGDVEIAVIRDSRGAEVVRKRLPAATVLAFDDQAAVLDAVLSGRATAYVAAVPQPAADAAAYPDQIYIPVPATIQGTLDAFALRKGDPDAVNFLNSWILLNQTNGFLAERWEYWFATHEWADHLPG